MQLAFDHQAQLLNMDTPRIGFFFIVPPCHKPRIRVPGIAGFGITIDYVMSDGQ